VYKAVCCGAEIVISQGATFPDCPNHPRRITIWQHFVTHIEYRRLWDLAGGRTKQRSGSKTTFMDAEFVRASLFT